MNSLIINFQPFDLKQNITIYIDNECKEHISAPIERINDIVFGLVNKYNIQNINLCGSKDYLSKFKAELGLRFNNNSDLKINIINK